MTTIETTGPLLQPYRGAHLRLPNRIAATPTCRAGSPAVIRSRR
ncbi:hypothetical protein [Saccharopolyspora shandongensis]